MAGSKRQDVLITIAAFETEIEASLATGALEAVGIRALVPSESSGTFSGLYGGRTMRAELQVFESDRDRALLELRRLRIRIVPPPHPV